MPFAHKKRLGASSDRRSGTPVARSMPGQAPFHVRHRFRSESDPDTIQGAPFPNHGPGSATTHVQQIRAKIRFPVIPNNCVPVKISPGICGVFDHRSRSGRRPRVRSDSRWFGDELQTHFSTPWRDCLRPILTTVRLLLDGCVHCCTGTPVVSCPVEPQRAG